MSFVRALLCSALLIASSISVSVLADSWPVVNKTLNETFSGVVDVFGRGRDPRYFYTLGTGVKPDSKPFRLDKYSGLLEVLPNGFDYDHSPAYRQYYVPIIVTSQSDKSMRDEIRLHINILDLNDELPRWTNEPVNMLAAVMPGSSVGAFVYQLSAMDSDTTAVLRYSIRDVGMKGWFVMDPVTGIIRLGRLAGNLAAGQVYRLEVEVTDTAAEINLPQVVRSTLTIHIGPLRPQFYQPNAAVNFLEKKPVGSDVTVIRAKSFQGLPLRYSLHGSAIAMASFTIESSSGAVRVKKLLNYDTVLEPKSFNFTVTATELDGYGSERLSSTSKLSIFLEDINDHKPYFELATYLASPVREDVDLEAVLLIVTANDLDSGKYSEIMYSIAAIQHNGLAKSYHDGTKEDWSYFGIGTFTGEVKAMKRLDYDRKVGGVYEFVVLANDGEAQARVRVPLININDEWPVFVTPPGSNGLVGYVVEDAPPSEQIVIGVARANDPDGDRVTYGIVSWSPPGPLPFFIDPISGLVIQNGTLATGVGAYILNISATDDGSCCSSSGLASSVHTSFTTFTINVDDVNNNRPIINCSMCNGTAIKEGFYSNFSICQLSAADMDRGNNARVRFSLRGGSEHYAVNPDSGLVYAVNVDIDRERMDSRGWIYFTGVAEDFGKPRLSDYCSFQIKVEDINDNRPVLDVPPDYHFYAASSLAPDTIVAVISAIDRDSDANGQVSFEVDATSPLRSAFVVNSIPENNTAFIRIANTADQARLKKLAGPSGLFTLPLVLRDHGTPELTSSGMITIQMSSAGGSDDMRRPYWVEPLSMTISAVLENTVAGLTIANLTARVPGDSTGTSPIRYLIPTRDSREFVQRVPFWYETESSQSKAVRAYLYSNVDAEHQKSYLFTVRAISSQTQLSIDRLINITVLDTNDNVPFFLNTDPDNGGCYYGSFPENPTSPFILVATAKADDLDVTAPNNVIDRYELRFTDSEDVGKFVINPKTGEVRTNSIDFDFERKEFYSIGIVAFDGAKSPLNGYKEANVGETFLRIQILDTNDNSPYFPTETVTTVSILEHASKGTNLTRLAAVDPDKWDKLHYDIIGGDPGAVFAVNGDSVVVNDPIRLDYEHGPTVFELVYRAFDNRFSATTTLTVSVLKRGDKVPEFSRLLYETASVLENDQPATVPTLLELELNNSPLLTGYNFSITGERANCFVRSGQKVRLERPLDRDELTGGRSVYRVNLEAFTSRGLEVGQYASAIMEVSVVDMNDNAPVFMQESLFGQVRERRRSTNDIQSVATLHAVDADSGLNGLVRYALGSSDSRFSVDAESGLVRTTSGAAFSYEPARPFILLPVIARDTGNPSASVTDTLTVSIIPASIDAPVPLHCVSRVDVAENAPPEEPLAQIFATDSEADDRPVNYTLDAAAQKTFDLRSLDGIAFLHPNDAKSLGPAGAVLPVRITATRGGSLSTVSYCSIDIVIRPSDESAPTIIPSNGRVVLLENARPGTIVFSNFSLAHARPGAQVVFSIDERSDWRRRFSVERDRPVVRLAEPLDREDFGSSYAINILAVDASLPRLTGTGTLTIQVTDLNTKAPKISHVEPSRPVVFEGQRTDPNKALATFTLSDADLDSSNGAGGLGLAFANSCPRNICSAFTLSVDRARSQARLFVRSGASPFSRSVLPRYELPILIWDNDVNGQPSRLSLSSTSVVTVSVLPAPLDIQLRSGHSNRQTVHKYIDVLLHPDWIAAAGSPDWLVICSILPAEVVASSSTTRTWHGIVDASSPSDVSVSPGGDVLLRWSTAKAGLYAVSAQADNGLVAMATVWVRFLPREATAAALPLRVLGLSSSEIVGIPYKELKLHSRMARAISPPLQTPAKSRMARFRKTVARLLNLEETGGELVISTGDATPGGMSDIFVTTVGQHGRPIYPPDQLLAKLLAAKAHIEDESDIWISALPSDACSPDPLSLSACPDSAACISQVEVMANATPIVIDADGAALVTPALTVRARCIPFQCPSTKPTLPACPCLVGRGRCSTSLSPGCQCSSTDFDGLRCETTARTFTGNGFAKLPLQPSESSSACNSGSIRLEFKPKSKRISSMTTLLLYQSNIKSPLLYAGCHPSLSLDLAPTSKHLNNFPAVVLSVDLCSASSPGPTVLAVPLLTSDKTHHQMLVTWSGQNFTLTVDSVGVATANVAGPARLFSGGGSSAFSLGGLSGNGVTESERRNFTGCLRNLWINDQLYDLWLGGTRGDALIGQSTPGCSTSTVCRPGFMGEKCEQPTSVFSFPPSSGSVESAAYLQWRPTALPFSPSGGDVALAVSVRADRGSSGILVWIDSSAPLSQVEMARRRIDEPDHVAIMLTSTGRIALRIQAGVMRGAILLDPGSDWPVITSDGYFHTIEASVSFHACSARLTLLDYALSQTWQLPDCFPTPTATGFDEQRRTVPLPFELGSAGSWFVGGRPDVAGFKGYQLFDACLKDVRVNGLLLPTPDDLAGEQQNKSSGSSTTKLPPPAAIQLISWRGVSPGCSLSASSLTNMKFLASYAAAPTCHSSCVFGVCSPADNECRCFAGFVGPRCLAPGYDASLEQMLPPGFSIERESAGQGYLPGWKLAAIIVPIVVLVLTASTATLVFCVSCNGNAAARRRRKAGANGANGHGGMGPHSMSVMRSFGGINLTSNSEAELLAETLGGQGMLAPPDHDAAGEEDVDLAGFGGLASLKAAIMEKRRQAANGGANGNGTLPAPPPSYMTVVGDLDRMLAARLAAADLSLQQPSGLLGWAFVPDQRTGAGEVDDFDVPISEEQAGDAEGSDGNAATNSFPDGIDLRFVAAFGEPYRQLAADLLGSEHVATASISNGGGGAY